MSRAEMPNIKVDKIILEELNVVLPLWNKKGEYHLFLCIT